MSDAELEFDGEDIAIEIIDDTPEADKGRPNIDYDPLVEPKSDLSSQEGVDKRIKELTHSINSERRLREQRERELSEATDAARRFHEQLTIARKTAATGERAYIEQVRESAELSVEQAKSNVTKAYEEGDPTKLVEAQIALTDAVYRRNNAATYIHTNDVEDEDEPETTPPAQPAQRQPTAQPGPLPSVTAWIERHPWMATDVDKRKKVLDEERRIVEDGAQVGSKLYFSLLDEFVSKNIADRQAPSVGPRVASGKGVPEPAARGKKTVRLTASQLNVAKALGISPEAYARELIAGGHL